MEPFNRYRYLTVSIIYSWFINSISLTPLAYFRILCLFPDSKATYIKLLASPLFTILYILALACYVDQYIEMAHVIRIRIGKRYIFILIIEFLKIIFLLFLLQCLIIKVSFDINILILIGYHIFIMTVMITTYLMTHELQVISTFIATMFFKIIITIFFGF